MIEAGSVCHVEIPAKDLAGMKAFYEGVFGWRVETSPGGTYASWWAAGGGMGGFDPSRTPRGEAEGVLLYVACDDIPAKLEEIASAGGAVAKEKTLISEEHGYYGLFHDPAGNLLGLWSRT